MEQVIYPVAYMMLEAESLGISSCIIGALGNEITQVEPDIYEEVREKLGLKKGDKLLFIETDDGNIVITNPNKVSITNINIQKK